MQLQSALRVVCLRQTRGIISHLCAVHEGQADPERQGSQGGAVDGLQPPDAASPRERARPPRSLHQPAYRRDLNRKTIGKRQRHCRANEQQLQQENCKSRHARRSLDRV